MSQLHVFVSFSGRDKEFVRRFIARLDWPAQDLKVWIFEDEDQQIPWGEEIRQHLLGQIAKCDVFVPIVSNSAFESRYTQFEVQTALEKFGGKPRAILPIVTDELRGADTANWPDSYREVAQTRFPFVDFQSQTSLEAAVIDLCSDIGVEYRPHILQDSRLPFLVRFIEEVRHKCPRRAEHEIGIFRRLMVIFSQFEQAFTGEDFEESERLVQYFVMMCKYEFPDMVLYYPHLVRGTCQLLRGQLEAAEYTFERLRQTHPDCDENVYAALGFIKQQRSQFAEALEFYLKAMRFCPEDPAAQTGVVVNRILCGDEIDVDTEFAVMEKRLVERGEDPQKILALKVFAFGNAGRLPEAAEMFNQLVRDGLVDTATVVRFAQLLQASGDVNEAVWLLERFREDSCDPEYVHHLASYTAYQHDYSRSVKLFEELVTMAPNVRQYRIEAAQMCWILGDRERARQIGAGALDRNCFPLPQSEDDYFYDGFANWILGNRDRANYDFERSGLPPEKHYHQLMSAFSETG